MRAALALCSALLGSVCSAGEDPLVNPLGFSLEISAPASMPVEGPCPLRFTLKYEGDKNLQISPILDLLRSGLEVETPEGWKRNDWTTLVSANGPWVGDDVCPKLTKGSVVTCIVYLHELFSRCTPGKAELRCRLSFYADDLDRPQIEDTRQTQVLETLRRISRRGTAVLRSSVVVDLSAEGREKLKQRIEAIVSRVGEEKDRSKRLELCRSVAGLAHPCLIPVLLQWSSDPLFEKHLGTPLRIRLADLCEDTGSRQLLVDYLSQRGRRIDGSIIDHWRIEQIKLTPEQMHQLDCAKGLWVRLYYLEFLCEDGRDTYAYCSLKSDVEDIQRTLREVARRGSKPNLLQRLLRFVGLRAAEPPAPR